MLYYACTNQKNNMSPNQRDPEKKPLKVYLSRELHVKFSKLAASRGCSMSNLLLQHVLEATKGIQLTADDYEQIAREIRNASKY